MTGEFVKHIGFVAVCLIAAVLLKNFGFKGVPVLISVTIASAVTVYVEELGTVFLLLDEALGDSGRVYLSAAVKILGVGYLSGMVADVCREFGEGGLASAAIIVGRLEILIISLPFLEKIIALAAEGV